MKYIITFYALLIFTTSFAQRNLHIKRNQTKNITNNIRSLVLDTLIIEDNAKIVIAEDVQAFSVSAKYVVIGSNVIIDGRRAAIATNGENGLDGVNATAPCKNGGQGHKGKDGMSGLNGADITLFLSIRSIGNMNIMVDGTKGGHGGSGGKGGKGGDGKALNCVVGRGGQGGNGGNGGNGGHVVINYRIIDENGNTSSRQTQLNEVQVTFSGGALGNGGLAGQAGKNGDPVPAGVSTTPSQMGTYGERGMKGLDGFYQRTITRY